MISDKWKINRPPSLQSYYPITRRLNLVPSIYPNSKHRHSLESARAVKRSRVDGPQARDETDRFHDSSLCFLRIGGHKRIAIKRLVYFSEEMCRLGFESGDERNVLGKLGFQMLARRTFRQFNIAHPPLLERDRHSYVDQN